MFVCSVTESTHGVETIAEFLTIEEARTFARKHARVVHYDQMKYFLYYVSISCDGKFVEAIYPQP
jgi:hypothetical protein